MAHSTRGGRADPSNAEGSASAAHGADDLAAEAGVASSANPIPSAHDLAGALHEVSNALTVIIGWIERAREEHGDRRTRALDIAAARARDARRIVRRSIGAKAAPDHLDGDAAPVSLREPTRALGAVVDDAVTGLEPEARRVAVLLDASVDPGLASCSVHAGATVVQILTNLLLNAISVSPPGGLVRVDARADGDFAVVGVTDQGPGVPPERRATLLRSGVSTRAGGAGIGLRYCAALADAAGGALSLASADAGARFELRWPLPPAGLRPLTAGADQRVATGVHAAPAALLDGVRILLVEDDDAVVDLLDTALTARGASIVSVRSAAELPRALASGPFDAALLDISPIAQDVAGSVSAVRNASPDARLVVMSGSVGAIPDLPEECTASWVRKPFEIREIVEALARTPTR